MTPEEEVRQKTILVLSQLLKYPINRMAIERQLKYNGRLKRFDLMVVDDRGDPFILIECKAPNIKLDQKVFDQLSVYNHIYKAPYLLITNGERPIAAKVDLSTGKYDFITSIPPFLS